MIVERACGASTPQEALRECRRNSATSRARLTHVLCSCRRRTSRCQVSTPTPAATSPGIEIDPTVGPVRREKSCAGREHRRGRYEAVDEMIDRAVGIVDSEIDGESTGADLLHDLLDVAGQGCRQVVPASNRRPAWRARRRGSNRSASNFFMYGWSSSVTRTSVPRSRPSSWSCSMTRNTNRRQVGRHHEAVLVQQLHTRVDDRSHAR